jgi:hypothetical protein
MDEEEVFPYLGREGSREKSQERKIGQQTCRERVARLPHAEG